MVSGLFLLIRLPWSRVMMASRNRVKLDTKRHPSSLSSNSISQLTCSPLAEHAPLRFHLVSWSRHGHGSQSQSKIHTISASRGMVYLYIAQFWSCHKFIGLVVLVRRGPRAEHTLESSMTSSSFFVLLFDSQLQRKRRKLA
jgi:hypothetical protein